MQPDPPPLPFEGMERTAGGGAILAHFSALRRVRPGDSEVALSSRKKWGDGAGEAEERQVKLS